MNKHDRLKRNHEKAVCQNLLNTLRLDPPFVKYGDDKDEPDILFDFNGKRLGIEVASAYYEDYQAFVEWTNARKGSIQGDGSLFEDVIRNPNEIMCRRIQAELEDKCSKAYLNCDIVWLCIEERAPLSSAIDLEYYIKNITIPNNKFDKIYLLHLSPMDEGGEYKAVTLMGEKDHD